MSDLCMCTGNCPIKEYCLRYMVKPNPYGQTYSCLESVCIPNDYNDFIPYDESIRKEEKRISYTLEDFIMDKIRKKNETN